MPLTPIIFRIILVRIFVRNFYIILIVVGSSNIDITVLKITILDNQILDHQLPLAILFLYAGVIGVFVLFLGISMRRTGSLCSALIPKGVPCLTILARHLRFLPRSDIVLTIRTSSTGLNFGLLVLRICYLCLIIPQPLFSKWRFCVLTWW